MATSADAATPRAIFMAAILLSDEQVRRAYVAQVCGDDTRLRQRVEDLIAVHLNGAVSPLENLAAMLDLPKVDSPEIDAETHLDSSKVAASESLSDGIVEASEVEATNCRQIGPYKLLEQIGEGGFGTVYMAEQTAPLRRKVALKILKPGMSSKEILARFEAERQALAMMDHPNIARVLDAGSTMEGLPYFVMELVHGIPVTEFCDEARLTTADRLRLFVDICLAVQHAHQKGIIHRDLKPSNVLVTMHDDRVVPKVIDFGIAKAINQQLTDRTLFTGYQQMLGTPLYMSPEQAQMSGIDVDTRSDVYSLGVLLYQLLTDTTPFDRELLKNAGHDDRRRIICEQEPPRPSHRLTTLDAAARSTAADRRRIDQRRISDELRGELDWIVMKALEKDRNRRYQSATAFGEDIERYLNDEPVQAFPPSIGYRWRKYARRHRVSLSWWMAGLTAMLIGGVLIALPASREASRLKGVRQQVDLVVREAETAIRAGDLLLAEQAIASVRALILRDREVLSEVTGRVDRLTAELAKRQEDAALYLELLVRAQDAQDRMTYGGHLNGDAAAESVLTSFQVLDRDDWEQVLESRYLSPEQKSHAREVIYETLVCLADHGSRWTRNEENARRSLVLLERAERFHAPTKALFWVRSECHSILKNNDARDHALAEFNAIPAGTALDHYLPGHTAGWRGDHAAAMQAYQSALQLEPSHFNSLFFMGKRLAADERFDEAIAYFTACIALRPDHVYAHVNQAEMFEKSGKTSCVEASYRAATEVNAPPVDRVFAFDNLLWFYRRTSQHEKHAEVLARLKSQVEILISEQMALTEPDNPETLKVISQLGSVLCNAGAFNEGLPLLMKSLERRRHLFSGAHPEILLSLNNLGLHLTQSDQPADAIPLLEEALIVSQKLSGRDHPSTLTVLSNLGLAYMSAGEANRAVPVLEESLAGFRRIGEPDKILEPIRNLGFALNRQEQWDRASLVLEEALSLHSDVLGADHFKTLEVMNALGSARIFMHQFESAISLLEDSLERHTRLHGAANPETLETSAALLKAYQWAGKHEECKRLALSRIENARTQSDKIQLASALAMAADTLLTFQEFAEAEPLARECLQIRAALLADSWLHFNSQSLLGRALLGQKKHAEAELLLINGYEGMKAREETIPPQGVIRIPETLEHLVELYTTWHDAEPDQGYKVQAAEWKRKLDEYRTKGSEGIPSSNAKN